MLRRRLTRSFEVLLIGPYPPPFGGVSVHIQRLTVLLESRDVSVGVLDHFGRSRHRPPVAGALKRNPLRYASVLPRFSASVTHYHHGGRLTPLLATALVLRHARHGRTIITVHGHDLQPFLESRLPFVARVTRRSLDRFDLVIAVSNEVAGTLRRHLPRAEITVLPAYLPPSMSDSAPKTPDGPANSSALVVAAYDVLPLANGDLYGLDVALGMFQSLANDYPSLRLLVFLAQAPTHRSARRYWRARLESLTEDARKRVSIRVGDNLTEVLRQDVIYIRPTRRDGDAVSVREALAFDTPVVASDIVQRPHGTRVVTGHDIATWIDAVADTLHQQSASDVLHAARASMPRSDEAVVAMLELYAPYTSMQVEQPEPASLSK